jgi:predicted esterase
MAILCCPPDAAAVTALLPRGLEQRSSRERNASSPRSPMKVEGVKAIVSGAAKQRSFGITIAPLLIGLLLVVPASAGTNPSAKGGTIIDSTLEWYGVTRHYQVYLPPNPPANPPMVLMLHGTSHGPGAPINPMWGWQPVANKYGFILVKPASTYNTESHQWNWNAYDMSEAFTAEDVGTCTVPPATACPDDAGFLRQLIVNLTAQYNVNPNQVYVAGFSSGAQMAHRVGVEISDLVAAVVIGSGTIVGQPDPRRLLCRALRLRLSRCRSGTVRKILKSLPATTAKRNTRVTISIWPPWTSLSIIGPSRTPAPPSRTLTHCAKTERPTPIRRATMPRDAPTTPKSSLFGRRESGTIGKPRMTRLAGFSLLPTRSSRSKKVLLAGTMAGQQRKRIQDFI